MCARNCLKLFLLDGLYVFVHAMGCRWFYFGACVISFAYFVSLTSTSTIFLLLVLLYVVSFLSSCLALLSNKLNGFNGFCLRILFFNNVSLNLLGHHYPKKKRFSNIVIWCVFGPKNTQIDLEMLEYEHLRHFNLDMLF